MSLSSLVVADIGGTHARFSLARFAPIGLAEAGQAGAGWVLGPVTTLRTGDFAGIEQAWAAFASTHTAPLPPYAAVALACPVEGERYRLTNSDWVIEPATVASALGLEQVLWLNDFAAMAHAVATATAADLRRVAGPPAVLPPHGIVSIVGPGTGLGVAQLLRRTDAYEVVACEAGHIGFAPQDALEDMLLAALRERHGRVSVERVVSGPGLAVLEAVLAKRDGAPLLAHDDDADLWQRALGGVDARARQALAHFCCCYGAAAGDIALAHGAAAVVLAGGLSQRLADQLVAAGFTARFVAKGRFADHMAGVPVMLLTETEPGLRGAAVAFARHYPG